LVLGSSLASAQPPPPPEGDPKAPPGEPKAPPGEPKAPPGEGKQPPPEGEQPPPPEEPPLMGEPPPAEPAPAKPPPEVEGDKPAPAPKPAGAAATTAEEDAAAKAGEGQRVTGADLAGPSSEVYAEDWWRLSRPVFELSGYYRVRSEFFHNFHLGRRDPVKALWPRPPSHQYIDINGETQGVELCGDDQDSLERCDANTHAGANMRFRLNPELHISDNIRIRSQIDLLDNIVLGSTPDGYANEPAEVGRGYSVVARGGYTPLGAFSSTQWAPSAGYNSTTDSIVVKRVWGEYSSPIGQLRFGRMPSHWGLGMLVNSGDGHDSDYQSTADRLMFITGIKSWDLYFGAAWDFANEGAISAALNEQQGQPYDLTQQDDVDQWVFFIVRRMDEQLAKKALKDGDPVFNGGAYFVYRNQNLANDTSVGSEDAHIGQQPDAVANGYVRRGAEAFIPDWWFQFRYKTFRLELEAALIWGSLENTLREGYNFNNPRVPDEDGWKIRQFGITSQAEFRAIEDRLKIGFDFGFATGDSDVDNIAPTGSELQAQQTPDRTFSTFRFHPDYRVDLILWRHILNRVQGGYFLKPSVGYDFLRDPDGQKIGGQAGVIWSRASEFVQTPGHAHDLGVEINLKLYFQAKDGVLNDDPDKMGGFFTSVEYGVLFPLGAFEYLPGEIDDYNNLNNTTEELDTETAQTVRWYLGILF
jgi:uncharacterized protein (TIGR04551 family)